MAIAPVCYLLEVMGNGGDFLESSGNREDTERGMRSGERGKGKGSRQRLPR